MIFGCNSHRSENEVQLPPQKPKPFPELTERNRLLGDLLPERTCYDVIHYLIDLDIDIDKKYISGFVDIKAVARNDFSKLQFDLARKMKLNRVEYLDKKLKTSRNKDAVFVEFPDVKSGDNFTFRVYYEGKPLEAKNPPSDAIIFSGPLSIDMVKKFALLAFSRRRRTSPFGTNCSTGAMAPFIINVSPINPSSIAVSDNL